jgi:hypothetical protein
MKFHEGFWMSIMVMAGAAISTHREDVKCIMYFTGYVGNLIS